MTRARAQPLRGQPLVALIYSALDEAYVSGPALLMGTGDVSAELLRWARAVARELKSAEVAPPPKRRAPHDQPRAKK